MKVLAILFLPLLMCNSIQQSDKKTFDLDKAKINGVSLSGLSKENIISMFGKPIRMESEVNEFTGEKFYMYYYNGISFEVAENGKAFPDEISSKEIVIDYGGTLICIGNDVKALQVEFPEYDFNLNEGQVNILIKNTTSFYIQIFIVSKKIKGISFMENY